MIDQDLNPYVLEVNLSPSLSADSKLDFNIKSNLILDALNLVGIRYNLNHQKDKSPIKHKKLLPLEQIQMIQHKTTPELDVNISKVE